MVDAPRRTRRGLSHVRGLGHLAFGRVSTSTLGPYGISGLWMSGLSGRDYQGSLVSIVWCGLCFCMCVDVVCCGCSIIPVCCVVFLSHLLSVSGLSLSLSCAACCPPFTHTYFSPAHVVLRAFVVHLGWSSPLSVFVLYPSPSCTCSVLRLLYTDVVLRYTRSRNALVFLQFLCLVLSMKSNMYLSIRAMGVYPHA
jgi:hypothetical protein